LRLLRLLRFGPEGEEIETPESFFQVLRQVVHQMAQEAADILHVSRPFLVKLLEEGQIPYFRTGTHRRIHFQDVMAYKVRRDAERREALDELTRLGQEMGLYDE
jgi:excisionase family DNA binding protein